MLKKGISIFLLSSFLFYHFGYHLYYIALHRQIEIHWENRVFETSFSEEERVMLMPLTIPYLANQDDYQITNTPIDIDGRHFRAIKQKYANDTLEIVYVLDAPKSQLIKQVNEWISLLNSESNQSEGKIFFFKMYKDYTSTNLKFNLIESIFSKVLLEMRSPYSFYKTFCMLLEGPPPEIS
jgi:hypothetical protein